MESQPSSLPIKKFPWLRIIGYGLLLYVATMVLIFIMSMVTGTSDTEFPLAKFWWVGIVIALILTACTWWLARRLHPATTKEALTYGIGWAMVNIALMLFITIPNRTTGNVFGMWATYLIYIGIAVGPLLFRPKIIT